MNELLPPSSATDDTTEIPETLALPARAVFCAAAISAILKRQLSGVHYTGQAVRWSSAEGRCMGVMEWTATQASFMIGEGVRTETRERLVDACNEWNVAHRPLKNWPGVGSLECSLEPFKADFWYDRRTVQRHVQDAAAF